MITIIVLDYSVAQVFKYHIDNHFAIKHFDCDAEDLTSEDIETILSHMGHDDDQISYMTKETDDIEIVDWDSNKIEIEW